jgi:hypothetical protein
VSEAQRRTSTYPAVVQAAKSDYELLGLGYRLLSRRYGIPRTTIAFHAIKEKWVKPGVLPSGASEGCAEARGVETPIMADGLANRQRPEPSADGMHASPVMKRPRRRPRKQLCPDEPQAFVPVPTDPSSPVSAAPGSSSDSRPLPPPEATGQLRQQGVKVAETARIIHFPSPARPPRRRIDAIQVLPEVTREEKARLRAGLAAIREIMSLEQLEQLERHERLLRRYGHLIEVYLEPQEFIDLAGLSDEETAERIVATQNQALRTLLPTTRDTLAGAINTLTNALHQIVILKRKIVGLDWAKAGTGNVPMSDPLAAEGGKPPLVNTASMTTEELRTVQHAMELLERHQHAKRDAPMPPPPDSIDDLRDLPPEPDEPEDPEIPPR